MFGRDSGWAGQTGARQHEVTEYGHVTVTGHCGHMTWADKTNTINYPVFCSSKTGEMLFKIMG